MLYNYVDVLYCMGVNTANIVIANSPRDSEGKIRPKLFNNVAESIYGSKLCISPSSDDAIILTAFINNYILITCYDDKIKYEKPIGDYVEDFGNLEVEEIGDGKYILKYDEDFKALPKNTINSIDRIFALGNNISNEMISEKKDRLIRNISFSKYNEYLNLNPLERDVMLITSIINNNIINEYHRDLFEYEDDFIKDDNNKTTLT